MGIAVASYHYRTTRSDEPLRTQLVELAREKPRFGIGGCIFCWAARESM